MSLRFCSSVAVSAPSRRLSSKAAFSTVVPQRAPSSKKPTHLDDATSALDYKLSHPHHRNSFPTIDHGARTPRPWSAQEAVSNILYNTPPPNDEPFITHTLNALVQNEPGVLARVSSTLAARGFKCVPISLIVTHFLNPSPQHRKPRRMPNRSERPFPNEHRAAWSTCRYGASPQTT